MVELANDWTFFLRSVGSRKVRMRTGHCFFPICTALPCSCYFYDEPIVESTVEYCCTGGRLPTWPITDPPRAG